MERVKAMFDQQIADGNQIDEARYEEMRQHRIEVGSTIPDWLTPDIVGQFVVYYLDHTNRANVEIRSLIYPRDFDQFAKDYVPFDVDCWDTMPRVIAQRKLENDSFGGMLDYLTDPNVYQRSHD